MFKEHLTGQGVGALNLQMKKLHKLKKIKKIKKIYYITIK